MSDPLDHTDKAILRFLFMRGGWATTNVVADKVGISWITADTHLNKLHKLGYVVRGRGKSGRVYWRANS